jgi:hypothetical protein
VPGALCPVPCALCPVPCALCPVPMKNKYHLSIKRIYTMIKLFLKYCKYFIFVVCAMS